MCPQFVHTCLFLTIMQNNEQLHRNFKFVSLWPSYAPPIWNPSAKKRLVGKQPATSQVPAASARRSVKAHKPMVAGIQWNATETEELEKAVDWRRRQQLEKILLHNRTAVVQNMHCISLARHNQNFSCTSCGKQNKNLSKFVKDWCGGSHDPATQNHFPRQSILLAKRQQLVREHNNHRTPHHLIIIPSTTSDPVACSICNATDPDGWRRFARFAKATCTLG